LWNEPASDVVHGDEGGVRDGLRQAGAMVSSRSRRITLMPAWFASS
jgi:hypothetical protein